MSLNQERYDIEVQNDDAINQNKIFFYFVQLTLKRINDVYLREGCLLIDAIMKDQLRKQSAAEIEKLNREKGHKQKKGRYI